MLVLLAACGPAVSPARGTELGLSSTTGGSASETSGGTTGSGPPSTSTSVDRADTSSSSGAAGSTAAAEAESSSESDGSCNNCKGIVEVEPDEEVNGRTAAGVIAAFESYDITLTWPSLEGAPQAPLALALEPSKEPITLGLGGENNCSGLAEPCPEGYTIPVSVDITTEDGILGIAEQLATIEEQLILPTELDVVVPVEELGGTFSEQVFDDGNDPLEFDAVTFSFRIDRRFKPLTQLTVSSDGGAVLAVGTIE